MLARADSGMSVRFVARMELDERPDPRLILGGRR
jgi:hypothetical protein